MELTGSDQNVHKSSTEEVPEEVENIGRLFPLLENDVIVDYMTEIPDEIYHLRIPLTISHFSRLEEEENCAKLKEENLELAHLIHNLLPKYSETKILKKLHKYGNVRDRAKLVIRNVLKTQDAELNEAERLMAKLNGRKHNFNRKEECLSNSVDVEDSSVAHSAQSDLLDDITKAGCDISESSELSSPFPNKDSVHSDQKPCIPQSSTVADDLNDSSVSWQHEDPELHLQRKIHVIESDSSPEETLPVVSLISDSSEERTQYKSFASDSPEFSGNKSREDSQQSSGKKRNFIRSSTPEPLPNWWDNPEVIELGEERSSSTTNTDQDQSMADEGPSSGLTAKGLRTKSPFYEPAIKKQRTVSPIIISGDSVLPALPSQPGTSRESSRSKSEGMNGDGGVNGCDNSDDEYFDLVGYIKEITSKNAKTIKGVCQKIGLNICRRPPEPRLQYIVDFFLREGQSSDEARDQDSSGSSYDSGSESSGEKEIRKLKDGMQIGINNHDAIEAEVIQALNELSGNSFRRAPLYNKYALPPKARTTGRLSVAASSKRNPVVTSRLKGIAAPKKIDVAASSKRDNVVASILNEGAAPKTVGVAASSGSDVATSKLNGTAAPRKIDFASIPNEVAVEVAASSGGGVAGSYRSDVAAPEKNPLAIPMDSALVEIIDDLLASREEEQANYVKKAKDNAVVYRLMEIFADADPDYIRRIYEEYPGQASSESVVIDDLIEKMLGDPDYPKRIQRAVSPAPEVDIEAQIAFVSELLPDADPNFLRRKVSELNAEELKAFVADAVENKNYPTMKEFLRKQQLSAQMRQYTTEFNSENFVKVVPDPLATFDDPKRKIAFDGNDMFYLLQILRNKFDRTAIRTIQTVLKDSANQPYRAVKALRAVKPNLKTKRTKMDVKQIVCENIPLLQEIAFIEHEDQILSHLESLKQRKEEERFRAKRDGLMMTCNCCYDDEVMPDDTRRCEKECVFCKPCIVKSTEVLVGEGKLEFPCLANCGSHFSLHTLQNTLPPNLFSNIARKKAVAEVKAAGIEDLECCPFCDFATIPPGPPETDRIFACQNSDCLKESCRLCKEPSHLPLRCDEVEKDEEVKKRVFIENKMTEALLRKCWKCGVSFYKEEGCNKMTCTCGATMCYLCGKPVTDYKHFNGLGGDQHQLCPLYSDTLAINQQNVLKGAQAAKEEIGVAGTSGLKNDPTADVEHFFNERKKKVPREAHLEHLERINALAAQRRNQGQQHLRVAVNPRGNHAPHHHHHHHQRRDVPPQGAIPHARRVHRNQLRLRLSAVEENQPCRCKNRNPHHHH